MCSVQCAGLWLDSCPTNILEPLLWVSLHSPPLFPGSWAVQGPGEGCLRPCSAHWWQLIHGTRAEARLRRWEKRNVNGKQGLVSEENSWETTNVIWRLDEQFRSGLLDAFFRKLYLVAAVVKHTFSWSFALQSFTPLTSIILRCCRIWCGCLLGTWSECPESEQISSFASCVCSTHKIHAVSVPTEWLVVSRVPAEG